MSFGSKFATPQDHVIAGFNNVFVGIMDLDQSVKDRLRRDFVSAHLEGNPKKEKKAFELHLSGKEFRWPWFDEWIENFQNDGDVPRLAKKYMAALADGDSVEPERLDLLHLTVTQNVFAERDQARWPLPDHVVVAQLSDKETGHTHTLPFIAAFNAGRLSAWPPNFPGDMTQVWHVRTKDLNDPRWDFLRREST